MLQPSVIIKQINPSKLEIAINDNFKGEKFTKHWL